MESRLNAHDLAYDNPLDDDDDNHFAPAAYLSDMRADPAQQLEADDWNSQHENTMMSSLKNLDDRSRTIIQRRWLDEDKATLHELADQYQISAERIRQLETNALKKLRGAFSA